jgi:hypothetical protein
MGISHPGMLAVMVTRHLCDIKTTNHMKAQLQLREKSTDSQAFKTQHEKNPHNWSINSCLEAQLQRSDTLY